MHNEIDAARKEKGGTLFTSRLGNQEQPYTKVLKKAFPGKRVH